MNCLNVLPEIVQSAKSASAVTPKRPFAGMFADMPSQMLAARKCHTAITVTSTLKHLGASLFRRLLWEFWGTTSFLINFHEMLLNEARGGQIRRKKSMVIRSVLRDPLRSMSELKFGLSWTRVTHKLILTETKPVPTLVVSALQKVAVISPLDA